MPHASLSPMAPLRREIFQGLLPHKGTRAKRSKSYGEQSHTALTRWARWHVDRYSTSDLYKGIEAPPWAKDGRQLVDTIYAKQ